MTAANQPSPARAEAAGIGKTPVALRDKALSAAMLLGFAVAPFFGRAAFLWTAFALAALTIAAARRRCWPAAHLGVALAVAAYLISFRTLSGVAPTATVLAVAVYWAITRLAPDMGKSVHWAGLGRAGMDEWTLLVKYVMVAVAAVAIWFFILLPESHSIPPLPRSSFLRHPAAGFLAIAAAAAAEEILFRGVMLTALDDLFGDGILALTMQAAVYAAAIWRLSNPSWVYAPPAFLFGLVLGVIRRRADGLFIPWLGHFLADSLIFVLLLWLHID